MGIVFGVTGSQEPSYVPLQMSPFEIRRYPSYFLAEVKMRDDGEDGDSFSVLAKYIGVFGQPNNDKAQALAMTAPVTKTTFKGTASSVVNNDKYMGFVLPFELTRMEDLPKPSDQRVKLRQQQPRVIACRSFSGWYTKQAAKSQFKVLQEQLLKEQLISAPGSEEQEELSYSCSQYHPPFTLPFLRRNEIWIELDEKRSEVKALLEKCSSAAK